MARKKCVICGEFIVDEDGVPYKSRYAHQKCFNIAIKTLQGDKAEKLESKKKTASKAKPKAELKDCLTEEEYKYKKQYYDYVHSLSGDNLNSAKVYALTDNYIKRYSFTFLGMYNTLLYIDKYTDIALTGDIVGIIPYYYDEAQSYLKMIERVVNDNAKIDVSQMYKRKTIKVSPSKKIINQINIEDINGVIE